MRRWCIEVNLVLKTRKAQSSVEYLSTYAWAFIVLLVTISALSFFGVFNSDSYTVAKCESGNQISCIDGYLGFNASDDNTSVYLMFRNNYPRKIVIENVTLINDEYVEIHSQQKGLIIPSAKKATVTFTTNKYTPTIGKKEVLRFIVTYRRYNTSAMTQNYTITGQLTTEAQRKKNGNDVEIYCGDGNVDAKANEECDPPMNTNLIIKSNQCEIILYPTDGNKHFCQSDCTCGPKA